MSKPMSNKHDLPQTAHVENPVSVAQKAAPEIVYPENELDPGSEKKVIRKVDWRIMPALGALYAVSLIDRVNLSAARIAGMDLDLQLSVGNRYSLVTLILFVTYIIFDFPGNIVMRKLGPAQWLPGICLAWGILTIGMGFTNTWGQLLACRAICGALEGGLFPGCIFLLSCWYARFEIQKWFSGFYCLGMLSSGFSSILAYEIQRMKGLAGLNGWRWIFIIGILTCIIAIAAHFLLIDFPDKATKSGLISRKAFLTAQEASIILDRIERDRGDATAEKLSFYDQLKHLTDWKIWEMGILVLCNNMVAHALSYFLPTILLYGMGFSLVLTYTLVFPPYVLAAIWMFVSAYIGDRYRTRGSLLIINACFTIIGISMTGFCTASATRYAGVFLAVASSNANIPGILSYSHNNIVGQSKRSTSAAVMIAGGGFGGIISSLVFRQQDAPQYKPGLIVVIGLQALTVVILAKNLWYFSRQNRKADRGEGVIEGQGGFRYTC